MINKDKQNINETYQMEITPKRLIPRIVENLNEKGLKSVNGGEYNYHKVYQVVRGRWADSNVTVAHLEVLLENTEQERKILNLKKQLHDA